MSTLRIPPKRPAWRGQESIARAAAAALLSSDTERSRHAGVHFGHYAMAVLELSLCNYRSALTHAAVLLDDNGPAFGAMILFGEAIDRLTGCGEVAELARAHLLYGAWLRRQRRRADARAHLRTAHQTFQRLGADGFAQRARAELAASGGRARERTIDSTGALTVREAQIAELVDSGAKNAEIAAQLFISNSTVEYHLRHMFQKLGVSSRTQLIAALRRRDG